MNYSVNLKGKFDLRYEGNYPISIEVSHTGFTSQDLEINESTSNVQVQIIEGVLTGQELVISASR